MAFSSDSPTNLTAIDRLRQLLLDDDRRLLDEIEAEVKRLDSRAGSDEALQASVAKIIDGALRDAEVSRHKELAKAIAPVVVSTIKKEIVNSRDEMVEALYPITGRLVQTYVAHAMRNAMSGMNQKLESGFSLKRWWLRLKASLTGRSYQELLLTELNLARVEEIYLIRRGSGEVIEHWERSSQQSAKPARGARRRDDTAAADGREKLVGSFLTALTEFSREAFAADRSTMQTLDLQSHRIFFRDSPAHLLAAKCAGNLPAGAESTVDELFLNVLQAIARRPTEASGAAANGAGDPAATAMQTFAGDLQTRLAELGEPRGGRPVLALTVLGAIGLALAGAIGWWAYGTWQNDRVRLAVEEVIGRDQMLQSYPLQVIASDRGRMVRLIGLVPNSEVRERLVGELAQVIPQTSVRANLQVVPGGETVGAMTSRIAALEQTVDGQGDRLGAAESSFAAYPKATEVRSSIVTLGEVSAGLAELRSSLAELQQQLAAMPAAAEIRTVFVRSDELVKEIARLSAALSANSDRESGNDQRQGETIAGLLTTLGALRTQLAAAEGTLAEASRRTDVEAIDQQAKSRSDQLAAEIEAMRSDSSVRQLVAGLQTDVTALREALARLKSPDQLLREFAAANAIFFTEETNFRDETVVKNKLKAFASLIEQTPLVTVHIVGHASSLGDDVVNAQLSRDRAERVASELIAFGVARERLVVESATADIVATNDPARELFDRRVEFRIGFNDERR